MRNPLSQTIVNIKPSGIRKFFDIVSEMKDAISLGVGEPDFDTPWHVRDEGIYSLEKGRTFYTSNAGLMELKEEICNYLDRRCNVYYNPKNEVIVTVGGSEGIERLPLSQEGLLPILPPAHVDGAEPVLQAFHLYAQNRPGTPIPVVIDLADWKFVNTADFSSEA